MANKEELILNLLKCNVLKLGNFKLRDGASSPIYIDLRRLIHYPGVVKDLVSAIYKKQTEENIKTDLVCGVPYTAIPFASVFSVLYDIPLIMKRKEAKSYGTKKLIEGVFKPGDSCLLIEDIVCSGTSIMETADALREEGLKVQHCVVVVDRDQGGINNLKKAGINLYPLLDIHSVLNVYCSINKVESNLVHRITSYLSENQYMSFYKDKDHSTMSLSERVKISKNPVAKRLLQIMEEKKTNLCLEVSTNQSHELLQLSEQLGPHICLLKTHIDILSDFHENVITELKKVASSHNFLILEDRKLADIGNTVMQQYKNGIYKIQTWADLVSVHAVSGSGAIEALKQSKNDMNASILVAEMGTDDALVSENYTSSVIQMANNHEDFVIGYTARKRYPKSKNMICICPDAILLSSDSYDTKRYQASEKAIAEGADIIMVRESKCTSADIPSVIEYKTVIFNAYLNHMKN